MSTKKNPFLKNSTCPYYHELEFSQKIKQFCWCDLKICTSPIVKSWNFLKNKALLKCFENYTAPIVTNWNLCKHKAFCWSNLKTLLHDELNFGKNMTNFMKPLENSDCPYYHELTFSQKYSSFVEVFWKFGLPLLSRSEIFAEIKQFCWSVLKTWTAPIITSWNFCKNKAFCWSHLKISTAPIITSWNFLKNKTLWSVLKIWTAPIIMS